MRPLVPAPLARQLRRMKRLGLISYRPASTPTSDPYVQLITPMTEKIYTTAAALGAATGLSRYVIQAIRKRGRELADPLPKYTTAAAVRAWLRRHPDFVARAAFKTPAQPAPGSGLAPVVVGRFDGSARPRGPRRPSPAGSAPLPAPSA